MSPDYQIITPNLRLGLIDAEHAEIFQHLIVHSASLHQWIDWCHPEFSLEDAEAFLLQTRLNWVKSQAYGFGVFQRATGALVGMVAINELYHTFNMASIGYWIADEFQGKGIGQEALNALVEFCFAQLKLTRVEIVCDPDNLPSQHLAIKCGAALEARAKNRFVFQGQPKEGLVFSMIPD